MATKRTGKADDQMNESSVKPEAILRELNLISKSLAVIALRFMSNRPKSDTDRIYFLKDFGFDRNEIAAMLTTSSQTVSNRLTERKQAANSQVSKKKSRGKNK